MNKRISAFAAVLAVLCLILSACGGSEKEEITYPKPTEFTGENSTNVTGRRFSLSLKEFSDRINESMAALSNGGEDPPKIGGWEILSSGLADDKGVRYSSYINKNALWILTAAVEDESKRLINAGCGCSKELLESSEYRDAFVTFTAIVEEAAGGYGEEDISFLKELTESLISGGDKQLYYERCLYALNDDGETVMIIVSSSTAQYAKEKGIKDFELRDKSEE